MRIVHYIESVRLSIGGTVRAALDMCAGLASAGHDVALLTLDDTDVPPDWREGRDDARLVFAENDGRGNFRLRPDIASGAGDFLQGVAFGRFESHGLWQVALSWHQAGKGIELLTVPGDPGAGAWLLTRIVYSPRTRL